MKTRQHTYEIFSYTRRSFSISIPFSRERRLVFGGKFIYSPPPPRRILYPYGGLSESGCRRVYFRNM